MNITQRFKWPNSVQVIPSEVFNDGTNAIVVPDGFLTPDHKDGGVYIITIDDYTSGTTDFSALTTTSYKISTEPYGYFYHMGQWLDMNGDGKLDFLTARSNAKSGKGTLVWFEHPSSGPALDDGLRWEEHIVCSDCTDVNFDAVKVNQYPDEVVVFSAEFFSERLSMQRVSTKTGELVDSRVIDDTEILSAYSVTYADVNKDGTYELIVNNHEKKNSKTGIFAYHFPTDDWMTGEFTRTQLAGNFQNAFSITVPNMSPGFVYPDFYPHVKTSKSLDPSHFLVAGDGDHTAHLMTPTDADNFVYDLDTIKQEKGTVGALAYGDVDGDGWQEVFVPDYDMGKIEIFKFSKLSSTANELFLQ